MGWKKNLIYAISAIALATGGYKANEIYGNLKELREDYKDYKFERKNNLHLNRENDREDISLDNLSSNDEKEYRKSSSPKKPSSRRIIIDSPKLHKTNPCGCSLPDEYKNPKIMCENPSSHIAGHTDSFSELGIKYEDGILSVNPEKHLFIDYNSVKLGYFETNLKDYDGLRVDNVFFLVEDLDKKCSDRFIRVEPNQKVPGNVDNMVVRLLGYSNGELLQIASVGIGDSDTLTKIGIDIDLDLYDDKNGGDDKEKPKPIANNRTLDSFLEDDFNNCDLDKKITVNSGKIENIVLAVPTNSSGEPEYKFGDTTITSTPSSVYFSLCDDGTDGSGKITTKCVPNKAVCGMEKVEAVKIEDNVESNCSNSNYDNFKFVKYSLEVPTVGTHKEFTGNLIAVENDGDITFYSDNYNVKSDNCSKTEKKGFYTKCKEGAKRIFK